MRPLLLVLLSLLACAPQHDSLSAEIERHGYTPVGRGAQLVVGGIYVVDPERRAPRSVTITDDRTGVVAWTSSAAPGGRLVWCSDGDAHARGIVHGCHTVYPETGACAPECTGCPPHCEARR